MIAAHQVIPGPRGAPTVVLCGSLGSTGDMWQSQVAVLAARARVVVLARRGHGGTPAPPGPYDIADLGGDLLDALDHLGIARAHLVGLSLGGMEAMWLAATVPERVERLVVLCTYAHRDAGSSWRERAALVREHGCEAVADAGVGRWFTAGWAAEHPAAVARARAMIAGTDAEGYASCCEAIDTMDLRPLLAAVTAPVLAVSGRDDPLMTSDHLAEIAAGVAQGRHVSVAGAHVPTLESPAAVTAAILDHLQLPDPEAP